MRVQSASREERDLELDEIQDKYEDKFRRIEEKIRKEEQDLSEAEAEVKHRRAQEMLGAAETIFSVFVKKRRRSFSSVASRRRMSSRASQKVQESQEDIEELQLDYQDLEKELKEKLDDVSKEWDTIAEGITEKEVTPRRTDIKVENVMLIWYPYWTNAQSEKVSAM